MNYKLILGSILSGLIILFIVQNVPVVEIRFLFWTFAMSKSLLMFIVLLMGIIIGWGLRRHFRSS